MSADSPPDKTPDPEEMESPLQIPQTDPEYGIWLREHPEFILAMLKVAQTISEERQPQLPPEKQEEVTKLHAAFRDEMGATYVEVMVQRLIPRVNAIDPTYLLGPEDLAEIQACSAEFDVVVDVALDIFEPQRTQVLEQIIPIRDYVRSIVEANKV